MLGRDWKRWGKQGFIGFERVFAVRKIPIFLKTRCLENQEKRRGMEDGEKKLRNSHFREKRK